MKEHIYTIPLTDALSENGECLLCSIEKKCDNDAVDYFTGAAMMEPDVRCETNEKGFCPTHYKKMKDRGNTLSIALVLQTRIKEINALLCEDVPKKKGLFGKKQDGGASEKCREHFKGCAACERVSRRMKDCIENFVYLLKTSSEFKEKFLTSKGLCMKHFEKVLSIADDMLGTEILNLQKKEMERILSEINRFCEKFDYRNADLPWENSKDAPERAILKLRGEYDGKF